MAWLIGAIATYGVVVLAVGIAVLRFLLGARHFSAAADDDTSRARRDFGRPLDYASPDARAGTRAFDAR